MLAKSKKVAIFVDGEFIPSFSGAANRFHYLTRALQEHTNTEVIVVLCDRGWSDIEQIKKEKFKTYLIHPDLFKKIDFLINLLEKEEVDILQFANLELAIELGIPLANYLKKHLVFEAHYGDYEFAKALGASKIVLRKILFLQKTFGKYFDEVIASSAEDTELYVNLRINKSRIAVIHSGINLADFPTNCFDHSSKKILFLGNLFFKINMEAVKTIKSVMYEGLGNLGYKFYIAGDISQKNKEALEGHKFIVMGKQTNLAETFSKTTIALAPVLSGSGIRIKILTYLNAGIPVITTSQGARGFDKKDLLIIEDNLDKYPALIDKLVREMGSLTNFSKKGRRFVRETMSWERISELVSREYDQLLKKPIISKRVATREILNIRFEDPAWIKEVIKDKRFRRNIPYAKANGFVVVNDNKIIIALEGLPGAGKSTFFNNFKSNKTNFNRIPETYIATEKTDPSTTLRRKYAEAEILKRKRLNHNPDKMILDRSFISTLAFSYAKYKTFGDDTDYIYNKKFLRKNIKSIIIPNYVFVFSITPTECLKRKKISRDDISPLWRNKVFLQNILNYYHSEELKKLVDSNNIIFINSLTMDEKKVYKFISQEIKRISNRKIAKIVRTSDKW